MSLVLLLCSSGFAQMDADEFTLIALPDIQNYSEHYPNILFNQFRWIRDNISSRRIKAVIGLGDLVNRGGNSYMWGNADAAFRELDGRVPYLATIGNNDYNANYPKGRNASTFNHYFGPWRYSGYSWYRGHYSSTGNENFWIKITAAGKEYVIIALEFSPRSGALSWASSIISQNPNAYVIIATHGFMTTDGTRLGKCDGSNADSYGLAGDNDGDEMWQKLVRKHSNIIMVLSGHIGGSGAARRSDVGQAGNVVHQMLSDFQTNQRW